MLSFARILGLSLCLFAPLSLARPVVAEGRSIIVLDASGSMWGQIDGRAKLEIAREALADVLSGLPAETEMGLMAYGHRVEGDCGDIELVVPPAAGTGPAITAAAEGMNFIGKTPLSDAVRQAALALRSSEEKATVILITDGIETCNADPCALGLELESTGVDFTAHVVGFGLTAEQGASVACLAENTGGVYIQASDASGLKDALQTTVVAAPAPDPAPAPAPEPAALTYNFAPRMTLSAGGDIITDAGQAWELYQRAADGQRGERVDTIYAQPEATFAPGDYVLVARLGLAEAEQDITITADAVTDPVVVLNAGILIVHPRGSEGAEVDGSSAVQVTNAAGMDSTFYGEMQSVVPAGDLLISVRIGEARAEQATEIAPGQSVELDIIAGSGLAVVDGYYIDGMKMDTTQHSVEILSAKKALDGSRASITTSYGPDQQFTLPPGDYVAIVTEGAATAEVPFTVKVGERVDVPVVLNAGVLFVSAPGANSIEVLESKADLNGNRKSLTFQYNEEITYAMPAGEYVVQASRGDVMATATATVIAGERSEVVVP